MRRLAEISSFLVLLSPLGVRGEQPDSSDTEPPPTQIRKEMLSEYKYSPPGAKAAEPATSPHSEASSQGPMTPGSSRDAVRMQPFEVHEAGTSIAAFMPLAQSGPEKRAATAASRLGIGVHYLKLGKIRLFVTTAFYVPILVGFDW